MERKKLNQNAILLTLEIIDQFIDAKNAEKDAPS